MRKASSALLITAFLFSGMEANAQARGPTVAEIEAAVEGEDPSTPPVTADDLAEWLRRLPGRFRMSAATTSSMSNSGRESLVDCVAVGPGPGVQCIFRLPDSDLATAALLGVDTESLSISYMAVNYYGIAEYAAGRLKGNTVTFRRIRCNVAEESMKNLSACERRLFIWAPARGIEVQYTSVLETRMKASGGSVEVPAITTYWWLKPVPPDTENLKR